MHKHFGRRAFASGPRRRSTLSVARILLLLCLFAPFHAAFAKNARPTDDEVLAKIQDVSALVSKHAAMAQIWGTLSEATDMMRREGRGRVTRQQMDGLSVLLAVPDYSYRMQLRIFELFQELGPLARRQIPALSQAYGDVWCWSRNGSKLDEYNDLLIQNRVAALRDLFFAIAGKYPSTHRCEEPALQEQWIMSGGILPCDFRYWINSPSQTFREGYIQRCLVPYMLERATQRDVDWATLSIVEKIKGEADPARKLNDLRQFTFEEMDLLGIRASQGVSDIQIDALTSLLSDPATTLEFKLGVFDVLEQIGQRARRSTPALQKAFADEICRLSRALSPDASAVVASSMQPMDSSFYEVGHFSEEVGQSVAVMRDVYTEIAHVPPKYTTCGSRGRL